MLMNVCVKWLQGTLKDQQVGGRWRQARDVGNQFRALNKWHLLQLWEGRRSPAYLGQECAHCCLRLLVCNGHRAGIRLGLNIKPCPAMKVRGCIHP